MLARYPHFSRLSLQHADEVKAITSKFDPYSDFIFSSLFAWDTNATLELSNIQGNILLKMPDYLTGDTIYSLLGNNGIASCVEEVFDILHLTGSGTQRLDLIPEVVIKNIDREFLKNYEITADRDNDDYIYSLRDLSELNGKDFQRKRNLINNFKKSYPEDSVLIRDLDFEHHADIKSIQTICKHWAEFSNKPPGEIANEFIAIDRAVKYARDLSIEGIIIILDEQPVAFSMYEKVDTQFAIGHFEKADPRIKSLYAVLKNEVAHRLLEMGCKYVNGEQDLGIETLRAAKLSSRPEFFLKKYSIQRKS